MGSLRDLDRDKNLLTEDEYYEEMGRKYGIAGYFRHEITHRITFTPLGDGSWDAAVEKPKPLRFKKVEE
jgi:hypothetical protein